MFLSMTGYGNDVYTDNDINLETEIKSLNSRYLDLTVRLPKELSQYEYLVRDIVKNKILRGKVSVSVNLTLNSIQNENLEISKVDLENIYGILNEIKSATKIEKDISISELLLFRDSFLVQSDKISEFDEEILKNSINSALNNLIKMRGEEGLELKKDIESRMIEIKNTLSKIEELSSLSTKEYFDKFKEKAKKLYDEFVDDEQRFLLELGILSEKHDVTEECIRLHSHIKLFNETIEKSNDIGRKLNFICQEMNREVNTINSKSISSEISHLGITIKEELEKIREQVQNIE